VGAGPRRCLEFDTKGGETVQPLILGQTISVPELWRMLENGEPIPPVFIKRVSTPKQQVQAEPDRAPLEMPGDIFEHEHPLLVPRTKGWLVHTLGLSPQKMVFYVVLDMALGHRTELSHAEWDFLESLLPQKIRFPSEASREERLQTFVEIAPNLLLLELLPLLARDRLSRLPQLILLEKLLFYCGISQMQAERYLVRLRPSYGKALGRVDYRPRRQVKVREPRRRRSSEHSGGNPSRKTSGPSLSFGTEKNLVEDHLPELVHLRPTSDPFLKATEGELYWIASLGIEFVIADGPQAPDDGDSSVGNQPS